MKKAIVSILLLIYFVVSTGFTVNMHYCMDKFHSWELGSAEDDNCGQCGMNTSKSSGCCRDEVKTLKLHQDLSPAASIVYHFALPALIASTSDYLLIPFQSTNSVEDYRAHDPPLITGQSTYLFNCVFRI